MGAPDPYAVAMWAFLFILAAAPALVCALALDRSASRWLSRFFAAVLFCLWLPLALHSPAILASLLP